MEPPPDARPFRPAPHTPLPRVLSHSGTVLARAQLVTITFRDYASRSLVESFGESVLQTSWYATVGAEYGLGFGNQVQKVQLGAAPAALDREAIAQLIDDQIAEAALPEPPAIGNQLVYVIYIPPSVQRGRDLVGVTTYHEMRQYKDARFPLVVVLDDGTDAEAMTVAAAQELLNTVTNPYHQPNDGYYVDPPAIDPWSRVPGEVGDLCEGDAPIYEAGLALPRIYSDASARVSAMPCKPAAHDEAWAAVSAEPSTMTLVRRGESAVFLITGWSTRDVPAWRLGVRAAELSDLDEEALRPELSTDEISNGTSAQLTLHVPDNAPLNATAVVYILSMSGPHARRWPVGIRVVPR